MLGLEVIGNFLAKRAVLSLIKISIDKFDTSGNSESKNKLLITMLKDEIKLETKKENKIPDKTRFTISNLFNYYKLAKAFERQQFFEDMMGFSKNSALSAVHEIEIRLDELETEKDRATIYDFLADFYEERDYSKFETYNIETLLYKDSLSEKREAKRYMKQALSEMINRKYEDALINVQSAIGIEPFNYTFLALEVEVLLHLNRLDNILAQIEWMIDKYKEDKNFLYLCDAYILMAKYYGKVKQEEEESNFFNKAYALIKELDDEVFVEKKIYLLNQIAVIDGEKVANNNTSNDALKKAEKSIRLMELKNFGLRHRLDFLEIANFLNQKAFYFYNKGQYNKSTFNLKKELEIREKVLGEEHPDTANVYHNLATLYNSMGDYEGAYEFMSKAVKIKKKVFPENNSDLLSSKEGLEIIKMEMKKE